MESIIKIKLAEMIKKIQKQDRFMKKKLELLLIEND